VGHHRIESGVYTFMIGRIGFRRLLPTFLTFVHAALLYVAAGQRPGILSGVCSESVYHLAAYQEEGSVAWEPMQPKPLTAAQKLAILLNLPAMVLGMPIALVFFHGNNVGSVYGAVPFVPLVWSGIGRWLDRLLGYIPPLQHERRIWRDVSAILSGFVFFAGSLSMTPVNHHRTGDVYWISAAIILWSGLFLTMSISRSKRRPLN
jgi:hypothetical protein